MSKFSDNYKAQLQAQASHVNVDQEGQSEEAARERLKAQYTPGESTPFTEKFGGTMVRNARGALNLGARAGMVMSGVPNVGQLEDAPFFGNEAIREQDKMDAPLNEQPGAGWGGFMGDMATIPGGPARTGGSKALSKFARVFGERGGQRALEGTISSMVTASPDEQGKAGTAGGVLGMTLGRLGDVAGKLGNGLVKKSDAAQHLEHLAGQHGQDIHIPLSLAADTEDPLSAMIAGTYRNVTPLIPFASGRLEGQRDKAINKFRELAFAEATPEGMSLTRAELKNPDRAISKIGAEFEKQYGNTVKSYAFNLPNDLEQQLRTRIKAARPNIDNTTLDDSVNKMMDNFKRFSDGKGSITGDNLLFAKRELSGLIKDGKIHEKDAYIAGDNWIDQHIKDELSQGNSAGNMADLQKYLDLSSPYKAFAAVKKAAAKAPRGEFSGAQLEKSSKPLSDTRVLGQTVDEVLGEPATKQSLEGKILGGALLGGVGHFMGLGPALMLTTGGHVLANKSTQRALMGDTAIQKYMADHALKHGIPAWMAATRRATTAEAGDEFNGYPPSD